MRNSATFKCSQTMNSPKLQMTTGIIYLIFITFGLCFHQSTSFEFIDEDSEGDDNCITFSGNFGRCIHITKCQSYKKRLPFFASGNKEEFIRDICGFQELYPLVCCSLSDSDTTRTSSVHSSTASSVPSSKSKLLTPPECGVSNKTYTRVVGGQPSSLGSWPWLALLAYHGEAGETEFLCGGSLITNRHILTASHCIIRDKLYQVRLGELVIGDNRDGADPIDIRIKRSVTHPQYNPYSVENDIAILELEKTVQFTNLIHPVCLPIMPELQSRDYVGVSPFVAGWGKTSYGGSVNTVLMEVQLPVISVEDCQRKFKNVKNAVIDRRVICAGFEDGSKDACQGDSGAPLVIAYRSPNVYVQIGIVSYGILCAVPQKAGVYTRVDRFLPFIRSVIEE